MPFAAGGGPFRGPPSERAFRFRGVWLAIGYLLVAATAWNSLRAGPPLWAFIAGDNWLHGVTYFVLAFWFGQLYRGRLIQAGIGVAFVAFGTVLELLQAATTVYRVFEFSDLGANTAGAGLAWLLLRTPLARILSCVDAWLARAWGSER